jgi:hypothetical protein
MQLLHRYNKTVLLEVPDDSLSGANLSGANLSRANLSRADLSGADLSGANLSGADLSGADLSRADLSGADLSRANLSRANLSRADLSRANLSGADLSGVTGEMMHVKSGQMHRWTVVYTNTHLWIGCQKRPFDQWWSATDDYIKKMDAEGLEDWKGWKPILQQIIALSPARPTGYVAPPELPEAAV